MDKEKKQSKISQKVPIIVSVLSFILSCYTLYLNRQDKKEWLTYNIQTKNVSIRFNKSEYDSFLDGKAGHIRCVGMMNAKTYVYNNSENAIAIQDIESEFKNDSGEIETRHIDPEVYLDKAVLQPGQYTKISDNKGIFDPEGLIEKEIINFMKNDIKNGCTFVCNPILEDTGVPNGKLYEINQLDDYIEKFIEKTDNIRYDENKQMKFITSKKTELNTSYPNGEFQHLFRSEQFSDY